MRPPATGSLVIPTIGIVEVAARNVLDEFVKVRNDDIGLAAHHLGGKRGKPVGAALGRIPFDDEIAALAITQPVQRFEEPPHPERSGGCRELVCGNP